MGKMLIAACVVVCACQPMYGQKAAKMRDPQPIKPKDEPAAVAQVEYVDACTVDFSAPPVKQRQAAASQQLVVTADTSIDTSRKATDDHAKVEAVRHGIEVYIDALRKDPYNADATLKLALAYDQALRRGCALAMLKRLNKLSNNPTFKATASIDRVVDNEQWFKGYRTEAMRAIGH